MLGNGTWLNGSFSIPSSSRPCSESFTFAGVADSHVFLSSSSYFSSQSSRWKPRNHLGWRDCCFPNWRSSLRRLRRRKGHPISRSMRRERDLRVGRLPCSLHDYEEVVSYAGNSGGWECYHHWRVWMGRLCTYLFFLFSLDS